MSYASPSLDMTSPGIEELRAENDRLRKLLRTVSPKDAAALMMSEHSAFVAGVSVNEHFGREATRQLVEAHDAIREALRLMGVEPGDVTEIGAQLVERAAYAGAVMRGADLLQFEIERIGRGLPPSSSAIAGTG